MRRMTAYLSALLLLLTLAACGGTSDLVGTYTLQRITAGGGTVDAAALSQAAQEAGLSFQVTLELRDDGTFRLTSSTSGGEQSLEGTWEEADGGVTLTDSDSGSTLHASRTEGTLVLSADGQSMTFATVPANQAQ